MVKTNKEYTETLNKIFKIITETLNNKVINRLIHLEVIVIISIVFNINNIKAKM